MSAYCRHCGRHIRWVHTSHGRRMPLDLDPNPAGNVIILAGEAIVLGPGRDVDRPRYMPHAATCPGTPTRKPPTPPPEPGLW